MASETLSALETAKRCPKKLSSACLLTKTSLRKHHFITVQKRAPSHTLHVPAPEHRCVGCTNCPHQPFFRSQPYRRADRVRDLHACDRRSNPLLRAMTSIVSKTSPSPHYGDEEMRAGAAWRGWCYLLTACDTQLGFTMRRTYGVLACNCQAGRDSQIPVLKRLWFGIFSARQVAGMGPEGGCSSMHDVTR